METAGVDANTVDVAAIYSALAYYHAHRAEMARVEREREAAIEAYRDEAITGPDLG